MKNYKNYIKLNEDRQNDDINDINDLISKVKIYFNFCINNSNTVYFIDDNTYSKFIYNKKFKKLYYKNILNDKYNKIYIDSILNKCLSKYLDIHEITVGTYRKHDYINN